MTPIIKRQGDILEESTLAEFEKQRNLSLPDEYREFLLKYNGGMPEPSVYSRKGSNEPSEVCEHFLGIKSGKTYADLEKAFYYLFEDEEIRIPSRLLPIADDPFGNLICLSTKGKDKGKVYFWHHEEEFMQTRKNDGDVGDEATTLIADSFGQFMTQFIEDEDYLHEKSSRLPWYDWIISSDLKSLDSWLNAGGDINQRDDYFRTPITLAVMEGRFDITKFLLEKGVSYLAALDAATDACEWKIMEYILQLNKGEKLPIKQHTLQQALGSGQTSLIRSLIEAGAPIDKVLQRGNALYHAVERDGNIETLKLLLKSGVKPGIPGHMDRLPLSNAICDGNIEAAKLLMDAGENLYYKPVPKKGFLFLKGKKNLGPLDLLDLPLKQQQAIKAEIIEYANSIGQTAENTQPLIEG